MGDWQEADRWMTEQEAQGEAEREAAHPPSPEERAVEVLAESIYRELYPSGGGYGDDPADWPLGGSTVKAKKHLKALAAKGLHITDLTGPEAAAHVDAQARTVDSIERMPSDIRKKYQQGPWWDGLLKLRRLSSRAGEEGTP